MYKLICEGNPITLGIADAEGNWDIKKFKGHVLSCSRCREYTSSLLYGVDDQVHGFDSMWEFRYLLPDGLWQHWAAIDNFEAAKENCEFHGGGRPYEIRQIVGGEVKMKKVIAILKECKEAIIKARDANGLKGKSLQTSLDLIDKAREILKI